MDPDSYCMDPGPYFMDPGPYFMDPDTHCMDPDLHFIDTDPYFMDPDPQLFCLQFHANLQYQNEIRAVGDILLIYFTFSFIKH